MFEEEMRIEVVNEPRLVDSEKADVNRNVSCCSVEWTTSFEG